MTAGETPVPLPVQLVLFDMDGVIADTEPFHLEATRRLLAAEGHDLSEGENRAFLGNTDHDYFTALKDRFGLAHPVEQYVRAKAIEVIGILRGNLAPNPGVCELLLELRMRALPACVASSSVPMLIDAVVDSLGLRSSFAGLYSASEVARGKPAPDLFLHAAARSGVPPEHCLVIEDAPNGIEAARAAGMRVVAVRTETTAGLDLSAADLVLDSLTAFDPEVLHAD